MKYQNIPPIQTIPKKRNFRNTPLGHWAKFLSLSLIKKKKDLVIFLQKLRKSLDLFAIVSWIFNEDITR